MDADTWDAAYHEDGYFWGTDPSRLAELTMEYIPADPAGLRLIDIGAGEGRDAVYFAERDLDVYATDVSTVGLEKAQALAEDRGVDITTFEADANDLEFPEPMDIVFSTGAVHFIRPERRPQQFERFRTATKPGGIHAIFAFVAHPEIPPAPDMMDGANRFSRDELQQYYDDWETLHSEEIIFDDDSGGEPHRHAARIHIAQYPGV